MNETTEPTSAPASPEGPCQICGGPLLLAYYRLADKTCCSSCAVKVSSTHKLNYYSPRGWVLGILAAVLAAAVAAMVCAGVARLSGRPAGFMTLIVGPAVGLSMLRLTGGHRGSSMQSVALITTAMGIWSARGLSASWALWSTVKPRLGFESDGVLVHLLAFLAGPVVLFAVWDLLWYAFSLLASWWLTRPVRAPITGPFTLHKPPKPAHPG